MNTEILQHKKIPSLCVVSGFKVAAINVEVQYMMEFPPKGPKVLKNIFGESVENKWGSSASSFSRKTFCQEMMFLGRLRAPSLLKKLPHSHSMDRQRLHHSPHPQVARCICIQPKHSDELRSSSRGVFLKTSTPSPR